MGNRHNESPQAPPQDYSSPRIELLLGPYWRLETLPGRKESTSCFITAQILDGKGIFVPENRMCITFEVSGGDEIVCDR